MPRIPSGPTSPPPSYAPADAVALDPLQPRRSIGFAPEPRLDGAAKPRSTRSLLLIAAALGGLVGAGVVGLLLAFGGSDHAPATDSRSATNVPSWADSRIGQMQDQALASSIGVVSFRTPGGNRCTVDAHDSAAVTCVVGAAGWVAPKPAAATGCGGTGGPWYVFTVPSSGAATASTCGALTTDTLALTTRGGGSDVLPHGQITRISGTNVYCETEAPSAEHSDVACWNPQTNAGFFIGNDTWRTW